MASTMLRKDNKMAFVALELGEIKKQRCQLAKTIL
jgi:hypothetical protein